MLEQNEGVEWQNLLGGIEVAPDMGGATDSIIDADEGDGFASFKM